jgi:hypothetical protein
MCVISEIGVKQVMPDNQKCSVRQKTIGGARHASYTSQEVSRGFDAKMRANTWDQAETRQLLGSAVMTDKRN